MGFGKAILLNGASSAGKTTLAKELQKALDQVFLNISIDQFIGNGPEYFFVDDPWIYDTDIPYPSVPTPQLSSDKFNKLMNCFPKIVSGFHSSIGALLKTGNNLIIDHGFHKLDWLKEFVELHHGYEVFMVGVICEKKELERREKARGDRPIGMAMYQSMVVHREMQYDLVIDTSESSAIYAAEKIKRYIETEEPCAIKALFNKIKLDTTV